MGQPCMVAVGGRRPCVWLQRPSAQRHDQLASRRPPRSTPELQHACERAAVPASSRCPPATRQR
eukprot:12353652-Alexandrium_andersonii.AAC.1